MWGENWYTPYAIMVIEGGEKMKKQLIVLVLRILENESSEEIPLTQTRIAEMIAGRYPCDRKTVGRNIKFLQDFGYPIVKTSRGFYMERKLFSCKEIEFIMTLIREADAVEIDKEDLCSRLYPLLKKNYKGRTE